MKKHTLAMHEHGMGIKIDLVVVGVAFCSAILQVGQLCRHFGHAVV